MIEKIIGTIATRYLVAILNLVLIFINARVLGIEGVGLIGLIVASVNLVVIVNGIFCGGTIVYFMNRYSMRTVLPPAYLWTPIGSAAGCAGLSLMGFIPAGYGWDIFWLAILNSLMNANARFLLGKDDLQGFNITFITQGVTLFLGLLFLYFMMGLTDARTYVDGLYIANAIALAGSTILLIPHYLLEPPEERGKNIAQLLREMFSYGLWSSADGLAETLTTRLNYFLMQRFGGLGAVGLLDAGTKMSESVWHISRSVAFIEYSSVARTTDPGGQRDITLRLFKLTLIALALVMGIILCIPEWVYTDYLFDPTFAGIRYVIAGLAVGIVALGSNNILSHYFIGSGKIRYSAACSGIGLGTLLVAGPFLMARWGVIGSAIAASLAYSTMLLFSLGVFIRQNQAGWRAFLLSREDIRQGIAYLRSRRKASHE